jgi:hypothetical protein
MYKEAIEKIYKLLDNIHDYLYNKDPSLISFNINKALCNDTNTEGSFYCEYPQISVYAGVFNPVIHNAIQNTKDLAVRIYARKPYKEKLGEKQVYGFNSVFYFDNLNQISNFLYQININDIIYNLSHTNFDIIETDKYIFKAKYSPEDNIELIQLKNKLQLAAGMAYV